RVKEYIDIPQKPLSVVNASSSPALTDGNIKMSQLTVNHLQKDEPVLKDISFYVKTKEKIGIVR
ncbi:5627_t:CDS:2, partial [Scutellospora calospora]